MRWVFLLLVMANGFYYWWWQQSRPLPEQAVLSAADDGAGALQLLSELRAEPVAVAPTAAAADALALAGSVSQAPPPALVEQQPRCWQLGPFDQERQADRVREALLASGASAQRVSIAVARDPDYWVHLGPFSSRALALERLRELQARGVDSFLIGGGELENGISLGLFSSRERAEAVQRRHRKQGQSARIHLVPRSDERVGLRVTVTADSQLEHLPVPAVEKKLCESIASAGDID